MIQKVYAGQSMLQQFPKRIVEQSQGKNREPKEEMKSFSQVLNDVRLKYVNM